MAYSCSPKAQYTTVPYSCSLTVSTPYEVNDHQVVANIHIDVNKKPKGNSDQNAENCLLDYTMEGESLSAKTDCLSLIVLSNQTMTTARKSDQSSTVTHNYDIQLKLLDVETALAPIEAGITDMHLVGHTLVFRSGNLSKNPNFEINFYAERKHLLKKDVVLINRPLMTNEYSFQKINDKSGIVKINLDQTLGDFNEKKKHLFKIDIDVHFESGTVLNTRLPSLRVSSSLKVDN